eukprot:scaffold369_cov177-Ochromonas_danica.AAC.46
MMMMKQFILCCLLLHILSYLDAMRLAIIGGGFSGLSTAFKLVKSYKTIHVFDPRPPGQAAASSISGGLMHPFAPRGNLMWKSLEGFEAAQSVLNELAIEGFDQIVSSPHNPHTTSTSTTTTSTTTTSHSNPYAQSLLRPVFTQTDKENWEKAVLRTPDLIERVYPTSGNSDSSRDSGNSGSGGDSGNSDSSRGDSGNIANSGSGGGYSELMVSKDALAYFLIKKVLIFHPVRYLQSLWSVIERKCQDSQWINKQVTHLEDIVQEYDTVVIANSYDMPRLWQQHSQISTLSKPKPPPPPALRVHYIRGRIFQYDNTIEGEGEASSKLFYPAGLLNGEYIVPTTDPHDNDRPVLSCGSSHEHYRQDYIHHHVNEMTYYQSPAKHDGEEEKMRQRLYRLLPLLQTRRETGTSSAVRLSTDRSIEGRLPIVGRHPGFDNVWVLAGLGSKGLIYHALMADYLSQAILSNDEINSIPSCLLPQAHYVKHT